MSKDAGEREEVGGEKKNMAVVPFTPDGGACKEDRSGSHPVSTIALPGTISDGFVPTTEWIMGWIKLQ